MTGQMQTIRVSENSDSRNAVCTKGVSDWQAYIVKCDPTTGDDYYIVTVYCGGDIEAFVKFDQLETAQAFVDGYIASENMDW